MLQLAVLYFLGLVEQCSKCINRVTSPWYSMLFEPKPETPCRVYSGGRRFVAAGTGIPYRRNLAHGGVSCFWRLVLSGLGLNGCAQKKTET